MKAIFVLLFFAFVYSIPNPVYTIKECFEKLYNVNSNSEMLESVNNELLKWKINEFYQKVDKIDPTLKRKIEECAKEAHKKYQRQYIGTKLNN